MRVVCDHAAPQPRSIDLDRSLAISRLLSRSRVQVSARLSCAGVSMEDLEHDSDTDSDPAYARGYDSPTDGDDLNLNNGTSMSMSMSLRYYTMCCDIDALVVVIVIEPDPFYDELADDRNEQWVRNNLSSRTARKTDAVLNCPSCFSVLSVDCQRYTSLPHVAYCLTHSLTHSRPRTRVAMPSTRTNSEPCSCRTVAWFSTTRYATAYTARETPSAPSACPMWSTAVRQRAT